MMHTVQLPSSPSHSISRRRLLRLGLLAAAVPCVSAPALALERTAQQCERSLAFYNVHTGESLTTVYWIKGTYVPAALRDIDYVLRDHHSDHVKSIDPQLLDLFVRFFGRDLLLVYRLVTALQWGWGRVLSTGHGGSLPADTH